jgi:antitoxin (DNA-binding transcriptional repressor) of toxin-antitoxin stability system
MIITAKELRFKISEVFNLLQKGREVIVTYRGKAKAKIVPLTQKEEKEDIAFGLWKDRDLDVEEYVRAQRRGREFDI